MTSAIRQILKLTISLVLLGLLSGCVYIPLPSPDQYARQSKTNHYDPIVLTSNEDMIRIKYLSVGPNAQHDEVLKLIADHCDDSYIETSREDVQGWVTVEAECTHGTDS